MGHCHKCCWNRKRFQATDKLVTTQMFSSAAERMNDSLLCGILFSWNLDKRCFPLNTRDRYQLGASCCPCPQQLENWMLILGRYPDWRVMILAKLSSLFCNLFRLICKNLNCGTSWFVLARQWTSQPSVFYPSAMPVQNFFRTSARCLKIIRNRRYRVIWREINHFIFHKIYCLIGFHTLMCY